MMLQGKVILITGVGPGMTRGLAVAAAREGAAVVLTARTASFLDEVAAEIRDAGGRTLAVRADVTSDADCRNAVDATMREFGRIDGLVNSAFLYPPMLNIAEANLDDWRTTHDVTCLGTVRMCQNVVPVMRAQQSGSIVNVSSIAARKAMPGNGAYAHAKAALNQITRQLAAEEGRNNIRANTIAIGFMMGASLQKNFLDPLPQEDRNALVAGLAAQIPLGRIPLDRDCAKSVLFLLSDYASEVTGAILDTNGGEWLA